MAVPTSVVPTRKSTFVTVAGLTAVALAVSATVEPTGAPAPVSGLVIVTEGTVTFTPTAVEVAVIPDASVARAVRLTTPAVEGIQVKSYGAANTLPTTVDPARKSTRLTTLAVPALGVAVELKVRLDPKPCEAPAVGAVKLTVGPIPAIETITNGEVAVLRFGVTPVVTTDVSVTVAVNV